MEPANVFLACPNSGDIEPETIQAAQRALVKDSIHTVTPIFAKPCALLAFQFNSFWCQALNDKSFTHFAMLHSDIGAEDGWLEVLLSELDRTKADVISCVVAIKDLLGDTSTAVRDRKLDKISRLSFADLEDLPETFSIEDLHPLSSSDYTLCVNSGLWVCKIGPWCKRVWFECVDCIATNKDGLLEARTLSEDWNFSLKCAKESTRVVATKKVRNTHFGRVGFHSWR